MKATTKIQMTVLAVAVCAFVAVPAAAFAWMPDMPELPDMPSFEMPVIETLDPGLHHHLIVPIDVEEFVPAESDETTIGEPPVEEPADDAPDPDDVHVEGDPIDPTHAPDVPSITATPSVTTTPTYIPERPYLPFTGGDATPYLLAGVLVALAGGALILVPAVVRKANAR